MKLVHVETGKCYRVDRQVSRERNNFYKKIFFVFQGPCRTGELFILSDLIGVGECK